MSRIIDIDAHFEPGNDWLTRYPELAARLPELDSAHLAIDAYTGDLLRDVPEDKRPSRDDLLPPGLLQLFGQEKIEEAERRAEFEGKTMHEVANALARVKWLDEQGIDIQHVICLSGFAYHLQVADADLRREAIAACNSWLAETCGSSNGRLLPIATIDYTNLDAAVAELERMRNLGSRIFLLNNQSSEGRPPIHPDWDKVWDAATRLGMAPMIHGGTMRMRFDPAWGNLGGDAILLRRFGISHQFFPTMSMLYGMVYSGIFERFPTLTVMVAEFGSGWMPFMMREIDDRASAISDLFVGKWTYPMMPSEYLARNVRITPLQGGGIDKPLTKIIGELPDEMVVFSSDFPHFEGFTDPLGYYREELKDLDPARRELFLGGANEKVFERMGDPL